MLRALGSLVFGALLASIAVNPSAAMTLDFKGTALPGSYSEILIDSTGAVSSASFAGQPVDFFMTLAGPPGNLYVAGYALSWSDMTYDLPYITGWSGVGYPYDPLEMNPPGADSVVNIGPLGGDISISSNSAYTGFYDGGVSFALNYVLSSPHGAGSSFTDTAVTGGGTTGATGTNDYDPRVGNYEPDAIVTFSLSSVTEIGDVPEPASWALMLAGFALIGGAYRVRRRGSEPLALVARQAGRPR